MAVHFFSRQTKNLQFSLIFENLHPCKHFCIIRPTKQKNRCVKNLCRSLLWWSGEFCFEFWWNGNWSWPYNHREIFKVFFFICIIYFFFHLWMSLYTPSPPSTLPRAVRSSMLHGFRFVPKIFEVHGFLKVHWFFMQKCS